MKLKKCSGFDKLYFFSTILLPLMLDVRHQDAILGFIRETMLSSKLQINNIGGSGDLSHLKDKGKKSSPESESYKLKISGEVIIAGN